MNFFCRDSKKKRMLILTWVRMVNVWLHVIWAGCMYRCSVNNIQCSPFQAVTCKIYNLKQHVLLPATVWRFTKTRKVLLKNTQVVIQSASHMPQGNEWIYGKVLKYTLFFSSLWATHFGKGTLKTEWNYLNYYCCVKVTTADLCK